MSKNYPVASSALTDATTDEELPLTLADGSLYDREFWGISRHELLAGAAEELLTAAAKQVGPEPAEAAVYRQFQGEIDVLVRLQTGKGFRRAKRAYQVQSLLPRQRRLGHFHQIPMQPQHRRIAGDEVQVRSPRGNRAGEPLPDFVAGWGEFGGVMHGQLPDSFS